MALAGTERWDTGFVRDDNRVLSSTPNKTNSAWSEGFLRDPDGRLVFTDVDLTGEAYTIVDGIPRVADGSLAITSQAGPTIIRGGLPFAVDGRLKPFSAAALMTDLFTDVSVLSLDNHTSDTGTPDLLPSWVKHASSVSVMNVNSGEVRNTSGSSSGLYYHNADPVTTAYRVQATFKIVNNNGGETAAVCARMDESQNTYYACAMNPNTTIDFRIILRKIVAGTTTDLATFITTPPAVGDLIDVILDVSNDEKAVYYKAPGASVYTKILTSGDNAIPNAGHAGLRMLRCQNGGQYVESMSATTLRPQDAAGTGSAATADPIQAPALLFTPNYGTPTQNIQADGIWFREQETYVRGIRQNDRMQIVAAGSVPGSGANKPASGALRTEIRSFHNNDFTITATAAKLASDTVLTFSTGDVALMFDKDFMVNNVTGELIRVNGAPSGTSLTVIRGTTNTTAQPVTIGDTFTVYGGDVGDSGSTFVASRCEVYDRFPAGGGNTDPLLWPDPVGTVRWYGCSYYLPADFALTGGGSNPWLIMTQWKGQFGGSPPRALEVDADAGAFVFGGTRTRRGLGSLQLGQWTRFVFGFRWDTSAVNGWSTVYKDGALIVPKQFEATMDKHSTGADPIYLKEGIYRTKTWTPTHIIHVGPIKVGTTIDDVLLP